MKYKFHVLAGLALSSFLAFAWAPFAVKTYVERKFPEVAIGDVGFHWGYLTFRTVLINRPNLKGSLDQVDVHVSASGVTGVEVYSGSVDVTLGDASKPPAETKTELPPITATDLLVRVSTSRGHVTLHGVHFTDYRRPEFQGFTAYLADDSGKEHKVTGDFGSYSEGVVEAHNLLTVGELPFEIPGLTKRPLELSAVYVQAYLKGEDGPQVTADGVFVDFVEEGTQNLLQVDRVRVTHQQVQLEHLVLNHPYLDPDTTFKDISVMGFPLTKRIGIGTEYTLVVLTKDTAEGEGLCADWALAIPDPVTEAFAKARPNFQGELSWKVTKEPELDIQIKNECKFECSAEPIKTLVQTLRAHGQFTYQAYNKSGDLFDRKVGPRLGNWVRFQNLPPWVVKAFVTLEDPGFWKHRGIIPQALENSLKENIRLGKFHRGGSTITMQLAKNLWLTRGKSLNRKAQELLMAIALESCLSKQEILELYVNVIEFGADLYGIGAASKKYFDSYPEHLTQEEAFYLASILPNPKRAALPEHGGLERTRRLMQRLAHNGRLAEEDLAILEENEPIQDIKGEAWIAEE